MWDLVLNNDFHLHAGFAALTWIIISVAECYLLFAWEVGVPNATQELDALSWSSEFLDSCSPGFQKWSFSRVIVGNWREPFYCMLLFPKCTLSLAGVTLAIVSWSPRVWLRDVAADILLGAASYIFLTSAHNIQFLVLCLWVSWECFNLQRVCEEFQEQFPILTAEERLERHDELGQAMAVLQERLHPMIVYLIFERIIYMVCDVAVWRCRSAPFTLVHYVFRHIVRILGVALVIWRIGRLNASMYDDLTGKVVYQMMRCHSMYKTSENEEFKRKRWELEDWISYLRQNENGRRKYCLRVCSFQCCLRDHRVALWTVTIVFLPVAQKILSLLPQPSVS